MTTTLALPDLSPADTVADQALATAKAVGEQLLGAQVTTDEQAQWAIDVAHQIREQKRALEGERDAIAKPLRALATKHTRRWKPAIDLLDRIQRHLAGQAVAFQTAERQRQTAALQAATTKAEVAQAVAVVAPAPTGLSERASWGWEVEDLAKVPREYFVLDTARLGREARERKAQLSIPGIKPVRKVTGVLR